jgi:hypothetical protein
VSVHSVEGEAREPMTDEVMQQWWAQIRALNEELQSTGAWAFAGAPGVDLFTPEDGLISRKDVYSDSVAILRAVGLL